MAPKYTNKLQGKRVLVLGGTSGIGFCVAEAAVEFGAIVTVASSQQANVDKAIQRLTTSYPEAKDRVSGQVCDLGGADVEANLTALFEFATKDGKLDHIVNTAGDSFGLVGLDAVTAENVKQFGQVRFVGTLIMAKLAPRYMHKTAQSSITATGGVNSWKPGPGWSVLAGWGSGKEGMARGLAVDLKPIRVNCVVPGAIETELWDSFGSGRQKDTIKEIYKAKTLVGDVGKPEDTAEAYLYLMRDTFVTGISLLTDGGYMLV